MTTDFCAVAGFPAAFPIARYRFSARMREPVALPHYAGSLLRGMLGAALRNVACMTRQPTCTGCPLLQTCPYSQLFETPAPVRDTQQRRDFSQIPHAYVVEPPPLGTRTLPAGAMLEFHIVLFGKALQQLALVVFALQRGLASRIPHAANNCICNKPCKRNLFGMKPSVKATSPSHTCHSTRGRFSMGWN